MTEGEITRMVKVYLKSVSEIEGQAISLKFEQIEILLRWAGLNSFGGIPNGSTCLCEFLEQQVTSGLDRCEIHSVLNANRQFLLWAKAMFPIEFKHIPLSWIMKTTNTNVYK